MPIIADLVKYSRLALGLRGFLRSTVTLEESKQRIAERLRNREKNFLSLVQKGIYQNPKSPYLRLLELAGCQFGDIEAGVNKEGIEATLEKLLAEGVYLSWEEFKGRKEVVRGVVVSALARGTLITPSWPFTIKRRAAAPAAPAPGQYLTLTAIQT